MKKPLLRVAGFLMIVGVFPVTIWVGIQERIHASIAAHSSVSKERDVAFSVKKISDASDARNTSPILHDIRNSGTIEPFPTLHLNGSAAETSDKSIYLADYNSDGFSDALKTSYYDITEKNTYQMLFLNDGDVNGDSVGEGTFHELASFSNMKLGGYAETALTADFDNDGDLDIYIPTYTKKNTEEHSYFLINDGGANFTEASDSAGIALRNWPNQLRAEGAQAVDINRDGWIDIYVASHLFVNNGNLTFADKREEYGLPLLFDEGIKFLDRNNDGFLDLVFISGKVRYFEFNPTAQRFFDKSNEIPDYGYDIDWDVNVYDFNNDGYEDIFVGPSTKDDPWPIKNFKSVARLFKEIPSTPIRFAQILLNFGDSFLWSNEEFSLDTHMSARSSIGDVNGDGLPDLSVMNNTGESYLFINETPLKKNLTLKIDVVDAKGRKNQQGRVATIQPTNHPNITFTRVVDSGSGYRTQNQYELLVGTPYNEAHKVTVYFASGPQSITMLPGETKIISETK